MHYIGPVRNENGHLVMPDTFREQERAPVYEAVEIDGVILLSIPPLDRERIDRVRELAQQSINDHRISLEDLAK